MGVQPRILVVEDEPSLADVLDAAFSAKGWRVEQALDGEAALATFRAFQPEVVLTDKNLPGPWSGVELVAKVRDADPTVGVVMMTGYGNVESARDTLNLGIDDYIEKPFDNIFGVVEAMAALRLKVEERRRAAAAAPAASGAMTIIVAATGARRVQLTAHLARSGDGAGDRVLAVEEPHEVKPSAKNARADLVVVDGRSFPEETTCLVAELKTRARHAACVVLSEHLSLSDVKRLIQLEVKALIDEPIDGPRFPRMLGDAVSRLRRARRVVG